MNKSKGPFDFRGKTVTLVINGGTTDILVDGESITVGVMEVHYDHESGGTQELKLVVEPLI